MHPLIQELETFAETFKEKLTHIKNIAELEKARTECLSKKGTLTKLSEAFKALPSSVRRTIGSNFQHTKKECLELFEQKKRALSRAALVPQQTHGFDPSLRKKSCQTGALHPYTHLIRQVEDIFISLGFEIVEGPTLEEEFYNFSALNIPETHPARDAHDTFWLDLPGKLLRTHTSTVQIREGIKRTPPFAIVAPGRVYRNEATDNSHDRMFWQCELLVVSPSISLTNLLFFIETFLQELFHHKVRQVRTRPSYFPFVEPGLEVDMSCPFCTEGCSTCKRTRWIEMGGAGMVHPRVLEAMNIDPTRYRGIAFGFGLTRLAMLKYHINDIRLLHRSPLHLLEKFS